MIGELQVMNLYSVFWEVIHMTSRTIRGLVPNLSGDNWCISSSPPFSSLPPPWETAHEKHGHLSVWSWTRSQPNCMYVCTLLCVYVCVFCPEDVHTTKTKGDEEQLSPLPSLKSHPSELDLTLEDGCGPVVHALTLDGSKALLLSSGSQLRGWTHYGIL